MSLSTYRPPQYTSQKEIEDVQYAMYLIMVRAGNRFAQISLHGR